MTLLIIYLTVSIGVSFLCSILEAVLLSISPSFIEQIDPKKVKAKQSVAHAKKHIDQSLSSILILNTFAHTMGAAGVGSQALQVFGEEWETLIAILLTLAILYFSEIIPKTLGTKFWRKLAIPASMVINNLVKLTFPLVWFSTLLTRVFRSKGQAKISRKEIIALASLSHKSGTLFSNENEYLNNILSLSDISVKDILTPRSVVHALPASMSVSNALNETKTGQFTRLPIYDQNIDDAFAMVLRLKLYEAERDGFGDKPIREYAEEIHRVSEKLSVRILLDTFIKKRLHLFLVEDDFGQTAGVVALEDAVETLLGAEIVDETDAVEDLQAHAKKKYRERLKKTK